MLGPTIRTQRVIKGYSQEYMAFRLNISQNAYSKIERQETDLTVKRVYQIAEILEVSVYSLLPAANASSGINLTGLKESFFRFRFYLFGLFKKRAKSVPSDLPDTHLQ